MYQNPILCPRQKKYQKSFQTKQDHAEEGFPLPKSHERHRKTISLADYENLPLYVQMHWKWNINFNLLTMPHCPLDHLPAKFQ